jgi:MFS transporter, SP family, arabinose:H+ symporter
MHPTSKLLLWSLTSALAGFLFGFDTVVISGAEQTIQRLWNLSSFMHGLALSSALWGTVLGAMTGAWPTDRFGRKKTLLGIGFLYILGSIGSGLAPNVYLLIAARFIGGLGIGISTIVSPLYISEIAPPARRGRLTGLFQFNIVFGIIVAYFSNYLLSHLGDNAWRAMLGCMVLPALVYTVLCTRLPESPRWLISRKQDPRAGRAVLQEIDPEASDNEIEKMVLDIQNATKGEAKVSGFWKLHRPIQLAFAIAFFNQLSGINAVLYFAPRILGLAGVQDPLLASISLGVTNLVFTILGLRLIDSLGRRSLLFIGSIGYILSLGLIAATFCIEGQTAGAASSLNPVAGWIVLGGILAFLASHAVGQGAVIWVFISEIFPNKYRAEGQSFGCFTHWFLAASLTFAFPWLMASIPIWMVFGVFCGMMMLQFLWVIFLMPETKGASLESLELTMMP